MIFLHDFNQQGRGVLLGKGPCRSLPLCYAGLLLSWPPRSRSELVRNIGRGSKMTGPGLPGSKPEDPAVGFHIDLSYSF